MLGARSRFGWQDPCEDVGCVQPSQGGGGMKCTVHVRTLLARSAWRCVQISQEDVWGARPCLHFGVHNPRGDADCVQFLQTRCMGRTAHFHILISKIHGRRWSVCKFHTRIWEMFGARSHVGWQDLCGDGDCVHLPQITYEVWFTFTF